MGKKRPADDRVRRRKAKPTPKAKAKSKGKASSAKAVEPLGQAQGRTSEPAAADAGIFGSKTTRPTPAAKPDAYEARKDKERARQAKASRSSRDIGPIPPAHDLFRRTKAAGSFRTFCDEYFPQRFPLPWSPDHLRIIARLEKTIDRGGCQAFAMPRGSGKTTLCEAAVIWAAVTGRRRFVALIAGILCGV